jgi:tRNA-dihydrouridine synthase B
MSEPLTSPFKIGDVEIANRLLLAPLAGIGNWFVRLQARRYGAGLAVSEMVSAIALERGNRRTHDEMLSIHPDEHPVSVQLFGPDPGAVRQAAAMAVEAGADIVDLNMGCPVRKVVKTGAGAALLEDPDLAIAVARAAGEGAQGRPVTVKLRSGMRHGDRLGFDLAVRLAEEAGVAAIGFHPRSASVHHSGSPDYALTRELAERLPVPVVLSGGLRSAERARAAYEESQADALMLARGALGNPWIFAELTGARERSPQPEEIDAELRWLIDRAEEHWGAERATRNLRKLYPPYLEALGIRGRSADAFMRMQSLDEVRARLHDAWDAAPMAA